MKHGTFKGYVRSGCRCERCATAFRQAQHGTQYAYYMLGCRCRECQLYWYGGYPLAEDDPRHGTINAYRNHRCRCMACVAANTRGMQEYRQRKRLRAMLAQEADEAEAVAEQEEMRASDGVS